jgi:hypothetical protein
MKEVDNTKKEKKLKKEEKTTTIELARTYKQARDELKSKIATFEQQGELTTTQVLQKKRAEEMKKNIEKQIKELTEKTNTTIETGIKTQYKTARTEEQKAIKTIVEIDFSIIPEKQIKQAIKNPLDKVGFLKRNENNNNDNAIKLNRLLTNGLITGKSYSELAKIIDERFDVGFNNSIRIVRTENHRVAELGSQDARKEAISKGVKLKKRWLTSQDERVRDAHAELDGEMVESDEEFSLSTGESTMYPGGFGVPELDINCFIGETKVLTESPIIGKFKRYYEGKVVSVKTSSGIEFSGTPNHPILTDKGWVTLGSLHKGSNVAKYTRTNSFNICCNPNIVNVPTKIATLFTSFKISSFMKWVRVITMNFHGDITESQVEIKLSKRFLTNTINSDFGKFFVKKIFKFSNFVKCFFIRNTFFTKYFKRIFSSTHFFVSFFNNVFSIFFGSVAHSNIHSLRAISDFDFVFPQDAINNLPTKIINRSNLFYRSSGEITFDNVVDINVNSFKGHIFNLHTKDNIYFVNNIISQKKQKVNDIGIIVHNCRCTIISVIET